MRRINSKDIREQLYSEWESIYVLNTDTEYSLPTIELVREIIGRVSVAMIARFDNISECDDVSIMLWGRVKEARNQAVISGELSEDEQLSWPIGICFGMKFSGISGPHWQNLCITNEGILMIEPQLDSFWLADHNDDVRFALI